MNELQVFENKEFGKIRALEINNEPYFVAKEKRKSNTRPKEAETAAAMPQLSFFAYKSAYSVTSM